MIGHNSPAASAIPWKFQAANIPPISVCEGDIREHEKSWWQFCNLHWVVLCGF